MFPRLGLLATVLLPLGAPPRDHDTLGRDLSFADAPAIAEVLRRVHDDGYRARAMLRRIVTSQAFTHR